MTEVRPPDSRTASLERKYRYTAPLYDVLDWPWERRYRKWRPDVVGDLEGRVLEAGVGTGHNLAHYPPGTRVHAVDLSPAMLSRARKRAGEARAGIHLRAADALHLDHLESSSFDWYVATFLYCVLPDELQPEALAEMARVLRPGGRFRLVEIVESEHLGRRLIQRIFAPFVERVYGARFDRHTRKHLDAAPELEVTRTRWLEADTYLLLEGRKV